MSESLFLFPDGSLKLPSFLLLVGVPVIATGRWFFGSLLIFLGLLVAFCEARYDDYTQDEKTHQTRYDHMLASEIVNEIKGLEKETMDPAQCQSDCVACLGALSKQWTREQRIRTKKRNKSSSEKNEYDRVCLYMRHELELLCQEAAYSVLRRMNLGGSEEVLMAVMSLHALVAKDSQVRERHLHEADVYGLDVPIKALQGAFDEAKDENDTDERTEQRSAELQRRGCLLLGALADGDVDMATKVVDEGALDLIMDCMDWYRYHEEVATWASWAVFNLCYDHHGNKAELVRMGGIETLCQALMNVPTSKEVARHVISVLFDVLRIVSDKPTNVTKIREVALAAGMHDVVKNAMVQFNDSIEIMMMGQEMLSATGYRGEIPQYQPLGQLS